MQCSFHLFSKMRKPYIPNAKPISRPWEMHDQISQAREWGRSQRILHSGKLSKQIFKDPWYFDLEEKNKSDKDMRTIAKNSGLCLALNCHIRITFQICNIWKFKAEQSPEYLNTWNLVLMPVLRGAPVFYTFFASLNFGLQCSGRV